MKKSVAGLGGGVVKTFAVAAAIFLCAGMGWAQAPAASGDLNHVLAEMDASAAKFRSAQANFQWDQFEMVVQSTDTQTGVIYYEGSGDHTRVALDIEKADGQPAKKTIVYSGGVLQFYQPQIDQMTVFHTRDKQSQYESYLTLGFGGSGSDLKKSWDITYQGMETIDGVETAKLDLVSKDACHDLGRSNPRRFVEADFVRALRRYADGVLQGHPVQQENFLFRVQDQDGFEDAGGAEVVFITSTSQSRDVGSRISLHPTLATKTRLGSRG
ncbi:MAG: LolA family protein [Acidobacteriaceae bacterium]